MSLTRKHGGAVALALSAVLLLAPGAQAEPAEPAAAAEANAGAGARAGDAGANVGAAAEGNAPAAASTPEDGAAAPDDAKDAAAVRVFLNDWELAGAVLSPEGRVMVPMRALFEALGARVFWDESSQTVRAFLPGHTVTMQAGNRTASHNGQAVTLDSEPRIAAGRLLIPLRFAAESFGASVRWDGARKEARVRLDWPGGIRPVAAPTAPDQDEPSDEELIARYGAADVELLARVINAEAYDEPYEGKVAVGAVIMNRLKSPRFPGNTIRDIIYAKGQFTVVSNGLIDRLPMQPDSRRAALDALRGRDPSRGALYFADLSRARAKGFWARLVVTARIGSHTFFRAPEDG